MGYYEKELMALALEACAARDLHLVTGGSWDGVGFYAGTVNYEGDRSGVTKRSSTEALSSLLDHMGVEYPDRPSAERVEEIHLMFAMFPELYAGVMALSREYYAKEPLVVVALLEGAAA